MICKRCRITLTYNLFSRPKVATGKIVSSVGSSLISTGSFGQRLAAKLQDNNWYPHGTTLGFALEHLYTEVNGGAAELEPYMLKGSDMLLYQTMVQLALDTSIVPAMEVYDPADLRAWLEKNDHDDVENVLVGTSFDGVLESCYTHYANYGKQFEYEYLEDVCGVQVDPNIVWVKKPLKQHWKYQLKTPAYGNKCSVKSWYVAAVLLVDVPHHAIRLRAPGYLREPNFVEHG